MSSALQRLLNKRLELYVEAEEKILQGQSYTISNRTLTRANLSEVRKMIDDLLARGATIDGTDGKIRRTKRVIFID